MSTITWEKVGFSRHLDSIVLLQIARYRYEDIYLFQVRFGFKLSSGTFETLKMLRSDNVVPGAELIRTTSSGNIFVLANWQS